MTQLRSFSDEREQGERTIYAVTEQPGPGSTTSLPDYVYDRLNVPGRDIFGGLWSRCELCILYTGKPISRSELERVLKP